MSLNFGVKLTEEQELVWQMARSFAQDKVAPGAEERDQKHEFPSALFKPMAELGLFGMKVPADDGGPEADNVGYALAMAAIAEADASVCVTLAVCNLISDILAKFANDDIKSRYLHPFLEGKMGASAFCLSEPEAGSDPAAMKTSATKDGDDWILSGAKQWITNGSHAGFYLVFARTDPDAGKKGMSCFVVEPSEGLTAGKAERKMGLRSSNTVPLTFENVRVPAKNMVGEEGQGYPIALSVLDGGRIGIAAQSIGIAEAAIKEGVNYAKERKAFGQTVADFQASQFAIADSRAELDQAWLLMLQAAAVRDEKGRSSRESSMAKVWASESCGRIVDRMLQLHGGYGYVEDYAIERLYRDARITRIYEGASEIQRIVIARDLLKER